MGPQSKGPRMRTPARRLPTHQRLGACWSELGGRHLRGGQMRAWGGVGVFREITELCHGWVNTAGGLEIL